MEYKRQQDVLNYEKLEDMLEDMPEFMRVFVDGCREDLMVTKVCLTANSWGPNDLKLQKGDMVSVILVKDAPA